MNTGRFLVLLGLVLIAAGLLWMVGSRLGLGKLPGDIIVRRDRFSVYFPVTTGVIISLVLSVVLWLFSRFGR
jgi:formate hydrogenlyase subunit 3/multisubunit Na+/H+ antiporter MnhD subunit